MEIEIEIERSSNLSQSTDTLYITTAWGECVSFHQLLHFYSDIKYKLACWLVAPPKTRENLFTGVRKKKNYLFIIHIINNQETKTKTIHKLFNK